MTPTSLAPSPRVCHFAKPQYSSILSSSQWNVGRNMQMRPQSLTGLLDSANLALHVGFAAREHSEVGKVLMRPAKAHAPKRV